MLLYLAFSAPDPCFLSHPTFAAEGADGWETALAYMHGGVYAMQMEAALAIVSHICMGGVCAMQMEAALAYMHVTL